MKKNNKTGNMKQRKQLREFVDLYDIGISYPLSQSNSYIVFSDKDKSLTSTKKIIESLEKKIVENRNHNK